MEMELNDTMKTALRLMSDTFKCFIAMGHSIEEATRLTELVMKTGQAGRQPGAVIQK